MTEELMKDLKKFLNDANLSTYEINAFTSLLLQSKSNPPTAKEISEKSNVPSGRIYEVLEVLNEKGLIEIIESRPKKYRTLSINKALDNLITYHSNQNKRKIDYLYDRAKVLESELYSNGFFIKKEPSKIFWSIAYGTQSILSLYVKYINEAKKEIIFNEFINKSTLKILPYGKLIYEPLKKAVDRGVNVRDLWCFEYDERPLTTEQKEENVKIFEQVLSKEEWERILKNADIFLFPGYITPALTILDAMSYELPVVATNWRGNSEMVKDYDTGFLINPPFGLNPHLPLARELKEILSRSSPDMCVVTELFEKTRMLIEDEKLRRRMGIAGRREIEIGKFSIKRRNEKLKEIFDEAIEN